MKKIFSLLLFVFIVSGTMVAQGYGNGYNASSNASSNASNNAPNNAMPLLATPNISWSVAQRVIWTGLSDLQAQSSLAYGQLMVRYMQGSLSISVVSVSTWPASITYRVIVGGADVIVVLDE